LIFPKEAKSKGKKIFSVVVRLIFIKHIVFPFRIFKKSLLIYGEKAQNIFNE